MKQLKQDAEIRRHGDTRSSAHRNLRVSASSHLRVFLLAFSFFLLFLPSAAPAVENFPPPQFERNDYQRPVMNTPAAKAPWWDYADIALLAGALAVGSCLALKHRRRRAIVILAILSLAYFGFVRKGCICPIGAIQNAALSLANSAYVLPAVVVGFLMLPILFSLFFGRAFCGGVCPLGALQDLMILRPVKVPAWLEHALGLIAYGYLGFAVLLAATGSAFLICQYDPFIAFFRLGGNIYMLAIGACMLLIGLFVGRPYCRFICPLGAIFRCTARLSRWRVTVTPDKCIKCRLCENACPFGAIQKPTTTQRPLPRGFGKTKLAVMILLTPLLMAGGGMLVSRLAGPLSTFNQAVRLARQIDVVDDPQAPTPAAGDAAAQADPQARLLAQASAVRTQFVWGGWILGAFLGAVVGGKLISVTVRRRRDAFEPDRSKCLSCGRCFEYCPIERQRRNAAKGLSATGEPIQEPAKAQSLAGSASPASDSRGGGVADG